MYTCSHPYSSARVTESFLRQLIAIVSLDLFTALIAIVSSKFIHLPRELVNEEWKIHFQLVRVTWPLMTEGLPGKG